MRIPELKETRRRSTTMRWRFIDSRWGLKTGSTRLRKSTADLSCEFNETKKEVQELKNKFSRLMTDKDHKSVWHGIRKELSSILMQQTVRSRERRKKKCFLSCLVKKGLIVLSVPRKIITRQIHASVERTRDLPRLGQVH